MAKYKLLVFTNPVEGGDAEYNDWYNDTHLDDVMKTPGFLSVQRFRLSDLQSLPSPTKYRYLAIYEIETDNLSEIILDIRKRSNTESMPYSPALDIDFQAMYYEPIIEPKSANSH